jgi:mono/diheme cytochrome c family protein
VSAYNGPDGALWIVDLYRGVIQHRTYVTSYLRAQVKDRRLEEGRDLGRIWRIVPDGSPTAPAKPKLDRTNTAELVQDLSAPSGWTRDTAQRLLVEQKNSSAVPLLQNVVRSSTSPLARLHSLWTLDGIGALDRTSALNAINDPDSRVCAAAIRLSERWLANASDEVLFQRVVERAQRANAQDEANVILQAALSLGDVAPAKKIPALLALATQHGQLPFLGEAIVSGLAGDEVQFIELASAQPHAENTGPAVASAMRAILGSESADRLQSALAAMADERSPAWLHNAILDGIDDYLPRRADGARVTGKLPAEPTALLALAKHAETPEGKRAVGLLANLTWPGKPGSAAAAAPLTPEETKRFERGRAQFTALCANCHQPDGKGLAGLAPPLVNSRWALGWDQLAASIVLAGKEDEGKVMPSLRTVLDDEAIASVLTYVRRSWGHTASAVSPATVANARAATASRTEPFHEVDLVKLSQAQAASAIP